MRIRSGIGDILGRPRLPRFAFHSALDYNEIMKKPLALALLLLPLLAGAEIYQLRVEGPIDSLSEEYVRENFAVIRAAADARLIVISLDTPGGFDTSMRAIIQEMLAAPAPVAVYVSPRGARAASAGFFFAVAADITAMAPGTNMGAAHPVSVTGTDIEKTMRDKVTNDAVSYIKSLARDRGRNQEMAEKAVRESQSYTAEESLKGGLCEYGARDLEDLLAQLEGKTVRQADGRSVTLALEGERLVKLDMSSRQRFLRTITNPNLAYFLLIIGLIGLYIEFTHPGTLVPGILGGISLLLAFLAFQILPINYIGLLLILLSIGLFIAEIKVQGFGVLGVGGVVAFVLGSVMLIDTPIPEMRPAMSIIITFALCFGSVFLFLTYKVIQAMRRRTGTGTEGLIGETGVARTDITASGGKAFVHGEWWNATADETIAAGQALEVVAVSNLTLKVKKSGG